MVITILNEVTDNVTETSNFIKQCKKIIDKALILNDGNIKVCTLNFQNNEAIDTLSSNTFEILRKLKNSSLCLVSEKSLSIILEIMRKQPFIVIDSLEDKSNFVNELILNNNDIMIASEVLSEESKDKFYFLMSKISKDSHNYHFKENGIQIKTSINNQLNTLANKIKNL